MHRKEEECFTLTKGGNLYFTLSKWSQWSVTSRGLSFIIGSKWNVHQLRKKQRYLWKSEPLCSLGCLGLEWTGTQKPQTRGSRRELLNRGEQHSCTEGKKGEEEVYLKFMLIDSLSEEGPLVWCPCSRLITMLTMAITVTCTCWRGGTEPPSPQSLCRLPPPLPPPCFPLYSDPRFPNHLLAPALPWQWRAALAPWQPTAQML